MVSGRKLFQNLKVFKDKPCEVPQYVCAPCSNGPGSIRDILEFYQARNGVVSIMRPGRVDRECHGRYEKVHPLNTTGLLRQKLPFPWLHVRGKNTRMGKGDTYGR